MAEAPVEASLNEGALKRFDPYFNYIIDTAKYVALYSFVDNVWAKTKVEGSLFVYARNGEPLYNILVLNRLDSKNLVEPITPQLDLQRNEPYLLYRNSEGNIFGIWFFDVADCLRLTNLIQKLMERSVSGSRPKVVAPNGQGVDIFKMLTQAQEAFSAKDGRPIPQRKQSPKEMDGTPRSVAEFFAKAGSNEASILTDLARPKTVSESDQPGLLQQLMANPAHSVEHIEKQQRVVTPHSADPGVDPLKQFLRPHSSGIDFLQNSVIAEGAKPQPMPSGNGFIGAQFDRTVSHPGFPVVGECPKPQHVPGNGYAGVPPFDRTVPHPVFPMTTEGPRPPQPKPGTNGFMGMPLNRNSTPPGFPAPDEEKKPDLMPPAMFTPREPVVMVMAREPPIPPEPLTRNQLLQAFDYLLRNDPEFMTKLHEAYVKSLTDKIF